MPIQQENVLTASDSELIREPGACTLIAETLRRFLVVRLAVTGGSMLPQIWPGDVLIIRQKDAALVQPGELVLYLRQDRLFVHRLLENAPRAGLLLTKGDSVPLPDPPVRYEDCLGVVTEICHRGTNRAPSLKPWLFSRVVAGTLAKSTALQSLALRLDALRRDASSVASQSASAMPCDPVAGR